MTLRRPCLKCGEPVHGSYCEQHTPTGTSKRDNQAKGYGWTWQKLSRRARRIQPWCTDCSTIHDLTADHLPEAWRRRDAGLPIRLQDVDVVCRGCNTKRGSARGDTPTHHVPALYGKAETRSHTLGGYL